MRLSLFTIPKDRPSPQVELAQSNAVRAAVALGPEVEVVVFGEPRDVGGDAAGNVRFERAFERSGSGVPLVGPVFDRAQEIARAPLVCYFNCDIVFTRDLLRAADRLRGRDRFLAVGERRDLEVPFAIDFRPGWEERLRADARRHGTPHGPLGIDYFLFPRGCFSGLPPFRIGRPVWDNWLLQHARASGVAIVDLSRAVLAVHQQHDYSHVPGGLDEARTGPDAQTNRELADGARRLAIHDADYVLTRLGIRRALAPRYLRRRLHELPPRARLTIVERVLLRALWALRRLAPPGAQR